MNHMITTKYLKDHNWTENDNHEFEKDGYTLEYTEIDEDWALYKGKIFIGVFDSIKNLESAMKGE